MSDTAPARIEPFYPVPENLEDSILLDLEDAELKQGDKTFNGKLRIIQQWSPMFCFAEFLTNSPNEIELNDAQVKSASLATNIRVVAKMSNQIQGFWSGEVEIGSDHKLDRVTFQLPNFPGLYGGHDYHETLTRGETTTSVRWSDVILESDVWRIALQPHRDIFSLRENARSNRAIVLSGVGEIRRRDNQQFKKKEVKPIIEALRVFLSFAFAEWSPPLLVVGSNAFAAKSWQMWANYDVTPKWYSRGWLDENHGQHLAEAFPGFCKLWKREKWQAPFTQAVTWLIEASRQSGGTDGAIALGQIPLEMLAWLIFVDQKPIIDPEEFERLSAASKLQMLLAHCRMPFDVPPCLESIMKLAKKTKHTTGPQIATKVRNTIIHPHEKNRKVLPDWERDHGVKVSDVRWETQQLFKWYITLVLLSLIDYKGMYANRLTSHKFGAVELVPWA